MNEQDQVLIAHYHRWLPFGGPEPADLLVEFGLSEAEYYRRVYRLLAVASTAAAGGEGGAE